MKLYVYFYTSNDTCMVMLRCETIKRKKKKKIEKKEFEKTKMWIEAIHSYLNLITNLLFYYYYWTVDVLIRFNSICFILRF